MTKEEAPDGVIFDSAVDVEVDARDTLAHARCSNDDEFLANARCAHEVINDDLEWQETAAAMLENYLRRRA